jgi:hypothetical protein
MPKAGWHCGAGLGGQAELPAVRPVLQAEATGQKMMAINKSG